MSEDTLDRRALLRACVGAGILGSTGCIGSSGKPSIEDVTVETVATGLQSPWGIDFLPDDRVVLTERVGATAIVAPETGDIERVDGVPDVSTAGQGGLLDVSLHPDYPEPAWLYLTYSGTDGAGATATMLGRGRLDPDAAVLTAFERLHVAEPFVESDAHYGSRVVFGPDGAMYMTAGDRQFKNFGPEHVAQDPTNELGTTLRLDPDGTIPDDNPFVDDPDVEDSIFSYGHRNPQGMTVHPETGDLWQSEHGEEDGDELNVIERGGNYGWPIATYACRYGTDDPVGDRPDEREDLVEPVYYWECGSGGFPPAGMTFYDGDAFPDWRGDLFVGNLAGRSLGRFAVDGREVTELDPLLAERGWRIRAVEAHPRTGHLYVVIDDEDAPLVRLVPET
ncbi:PQQ-dependent sugar dehydrogenase [Natronoarchaeum sp. GCM10025321]|uniref:PQQ-dependent sugar dehydrogenase n=1 Tax=Natronoarchaeum sp. GCM10025321 TaxID=3252684 RepID=UPI0036132123